jgi:hypothetical protein
VWLGGIADSELRRVGRLADGWLPSFVTPDDAAQGWQTVTRIAEEHNREIDPEHFSESVRFETKLSLTRHFRMSTVKKNVIQELQLLIIDEVSMLRPDVLDAMDYMLQRVRRNRQSFGGVQVLFIGDLMQLPPVIKNEEWAVLKKYYSGKFFFHAHAILKDPPLYVELDKIFRQQDPVFINILNNLRNNQITQEDQLKLNEYLNPDFVAPADAGFITLTTHNHKADEINKKALEELKSQALKYYAEITGEFPERIYPLSRYHHAWYLDSQF